MEPSTTWNSTADGNRATARAARTTGIASTGTRWPLSSARDACNQPGGDRPPRPAQEGAPMLLRHATLRKNLSSISRHGLLCSKSQGRRRVVWLHAPSRSAWAVLHTIKRHGGRVEDVVILEIQVPRNWLRRNRRRL